MESGAYQKAKMSELLQKPNETCDTEKPTYHGSHVKKQQKWILDCHGMEESCDKDKEYG